MFIVFVDVLELIFSIFLIDIYLSSFFMLLSPLFSFILQF